jgi:hypothetical protein
VAPGGCFNWAPIEPFVDLLAGLGKGERCEATLSWARVWWFVTVSVWVYLYPLRRVLKVHFDPFEDCVNVNARYDTFCAECAIGSTIVLDAPDGTPR